MKSTERKEKMVTVKLKVNEKERFINIQSDITQLELMDRLRKMGLFSGKHSNATKIFLEVNHKKKEILPEDYKLTFPPTAAILIETAAD